MAHFDLPLYARDVATSVRQMDDAAPNEYRAALAGQDKVAVLVEMDARLVLLAKQ